MGKGKVKRKGNENWERKRRKSLIQSYLRLDAAVQKENVSGLKMHLIGSIFQNFLMHPTSSHSILRNQVGWKNIQPCFFLFFLACSRLNH